MRTIPNPTRRLLPEQFDVRINGPDCDPVSDADLRRLFPGSQLTQARLERLREWPRIAVACDNTVIAIATCHKTDLELRVPEIGLDLQCRCDAREVLTVLFDAIELAGLAGGCRRLVVNPPKMSVSFLERRGYRSISEGCAGGWTEKALF